jgi:hypothetical protein
MIYLFPFAGVPFLFSPSPGSNPLEGAIKIFFGPLSANFPRNLNKAL